MGEKAFDLAELRSSQERDAVLADTRAQIDRAGRDDCVDCDAPISADRRAAAPFALRCVMCQSTHEQERPKR